MKTKKFNRKLMLHKTTIANLDANKMKRIQGGIQTNDNNTNCTGPCVCLSDQQVCWTETICCPTVTTNCGVVCVC